MSRYELGAADPIQTKKVYYTFGGLDVKVYGGEGDDLSKFHWVTGIELHEKANEDDSIVIEWVFSEKADQDQIRQAKRVMIEASNEYGHRARRFAEDLRFLGESMPINVDDIVLGGKTAFLCRLTDWEEWKRELKNGSTAE